MSSDPLTEAGARGGDKVAVPELSTSHDYAGVAIRPIYLDGGGTLVCGSMPMRSTEYSSQDGAEPVDTESAEATTAPSADGFHEQPAGETSTASSTP
jgi:hypothetical protein